MPLSYDEGMYWGLHFLNGSLSLTIVKSSTLGQTSSACGCSNQRMLTGRGELGINRGVAIKASEGPLSIVAAWANEHDMKLLAATLDALAVEHCQFTPERPGAPTLVSGRGRRQSVW